MVKHFCDLCQKETRESHLVKIVINETKYPHPSQGTEREGRVYETCPGCRKAIIDTCEGLKEIPHFDPST